MEVLNMPEGKTSLISDLTGLSKPLTKLIETVGNGINVATQPWQIKRNAKADAEAIDTIKESLSTLPGDVTYNGPNFSITVSGGSIEESAISRMVNTEIERQINLNNIVQKTAKLLSLKETVSSTPVNHDWWTRYQNIAQDISDDAMRDLWAQILAGEIETPNSYSYRALDFLKNISFDEAQLIQNILKYTFESGDGIYIFGGKGYLKTVNIPFAQGLILEELNLGIDELILTIAKNATLHYRISNSNNLLKITNNTDSAVKIPILKLTALGREIHKLTPPHYEYDNIIQHIRYLNHPTLEYTIIEDVSFINETRFSWLPTSEIPISL